MRFAFTLSAAGALGTFALGAPVLAEEVTPEAPTPSKSTSPMDVIMLKNGAMVRGTVAEIVPDDHVLFMTMNGEQRTYPMSEVAYAGPASGAPRPPEPSLTTNASERKRRSVHTRTRVTFHGKKPDLVVYVEASSKGGAPRPLCQTPCSAELEPGLYRFAVGRASDARWTRTSQLVTIRGGERLMVDYETHGGARAAGWAILGLGSATGTVLIAAGAAATPADADLLLIGSVASGLSLAFGLALGLWGDRAWVWKPRAATNAAGISFDVSPWMTAGRGPGLGLVASF